MSICYNIIVAKKYMYLGVDESWWALWSSKPARGVKSFLGEFDSHILPPQVTARLVEIYKLFLLPKNHLVIFKFSSREPLRVTFDKMLLMAFCFVILIK